MTTIQIRRKGIITLPVSLRKKYKLKEGQTLTIIDLGDGMILLKTKVFQVDRLADQIAKNLRDENVTLDDLLQVLDEVRKTYD